MLPIAYYFLQVLLCSGLMMGYYWLVLRNKRFHQYNRFYLLAVALLSWIIPLIKIRWSHPAVTEEPTMIRFLSVVANNNSAMDENLTKGFKWSLDMVASGIYFTIAFILLAGIVLALYRIYRLLQTHSRKSVGEVYLILTNAKGTPFSFFRYIFWNEEIDISSESGKQVLKHELTHVQQKHSIDKLMIQFMLVAGWFNPFFWLLKKEMGMIHEFIADNRAVKNGDTASLAQMLLLAAYPRQHFLLTNPFFFSSIKRRMQMLNNQRNPKFSYVRRLIVLPLLVIVVVLFAFRNKDQQENKTLSFGSVVEKVINVVKMENTDFYQVTASDTLVKKLDSIQLQNNGISTKTPLQLNSGRQSSFNKVIFFVDGIRKDTNVLHDLNPSEIESINVLKDSSAIVKYGEEAKNGVVEIITKKKSPNPDSYYVIGDSSGKPFTNPPLYIVDGVKAKIGMRLNPNNIDSINISKNQSAIDKYGLEARNGVVEIKTKPIEIRTLKYEAVPGKENSNQDNKPRPDVDKIFTEVTTPAEFPGGLSAWVTYLERNLQRDLVKNNGGPPGRYTVIVSFLVGENGELSNIKAINDPGYGTKEEAERLIKKGPNWKPAIQNSIHVKSNHKQSITFLVM